MTLCGTSIQAVIRFERSLVKYTFIKYKTNEPTEMIYDLKATVKTDPMKP